MAKYGPIALAVYLGIFVLTMTGFSIAIMQGFEVEGASSTAGIFGAAWVATKLTQPIRIGATLALTPLIGKALERLKGRS